VLVSLNPVAQPRADTVLGEAERDFIREPALV